MEIWNAVLLPALLFAAGVALLIFSVERLIENLAKAAVVTGVSAFMLAVLFTGMDFENWAFGIASALGDLPGIALGSAFGAALFLAGVAVPAGGLLVPFDVRVPRDYLLLMVASPLLLLAFLPGGQVGRVEGAALFGAMLLALAYIYRKEKSGRSLMRDQEAVEAAAEAAREGRGSKFYLALCAVLVVGVVVGSELAVRGARGLVEGLRLDETAFGMTFVGLVMSLEEVLLVVQPVRRGHVSLAAGNVVGSLIFFATGNVGLIALTRPLPIGSAVLGLYWPFLMGATALVGLFLWRGRVKRPEAAILAGVYVAFWILAYARG